MSDRLNPNLYTNGMVCLSLLGTWQGAPQEQWTPGTSTLLQVFVSIQSLVLVDEPYYLEPGYEQQREREGGRLLARDYNENAVLYALTVSVAQANASPVGRVSSASPRTRRRRSSARSASTRRRTATTCCGCWTSTSRRAGPRSSSAP